MTTQSNIFKPTLKFSQKTRLSNVNDPMIYFVCLKLAPRIRVKIRLDTCKYRYYINNTYGSESFTKQSYKVCIAHCFSYIKRQSKLHCK